MFPGTPQQKFLKFYQNKVDGIFPEISGSKTVFDGGNTVVGSGSTITSVDPDINFPIVLRKQLVLLTTLSMIWVCHSPLVTPNLKWKRTRKVIYIDNREQLVLATKLKTLRS